MKKRSKINGIFNRTDKRWKKLLEVAKPKEDGDSYIIDEKSQGIITYQMTNPKNLMAKSYLKEAFNLYSKGQALLKEGEYLKAYEYVLVSYLLVQIAGHVDYYATIRAFKKKNNVKIDKKQLVELLQKNNKKLIHISEQIYKAKEDIAHKLYKKDMEKEMQAINRKYNMHFTYPGDISFISSIRPSKKRLAIDKNVLKFQKQKEEDKAVVTKKLSELEEALKDKKYDLESLEKIQEHKNEDVKKIVQAEIDKNKKDIEILSKELQDLKKVS